MSRNDSFLYTGAPSNREVKERERLQDKEEKQRALAPVEDLIFAEIEKLKAENRQRLVDLVNPDTSDDNVKALLLAVRFNGEDLKKLSTRLSNIVRPPVSKRKVASNG